MTPQDLLLEWAASARLYKKVAVLVEDLRDIPFWKNMLKNLAHPPIIADFPYKAAVGKSDIGRFVPYLAEKHVKGYVLICRDSDNEYFYDTKTYLSQPYILQTYAYSIENIKSYPPHLTQICEDICHLNYDFEGFFQQYSEIIYPVFCYYLYFQQEKYPKNWKDLISKATLEEVISLAQLNKKGEYEWIENIDKEQDIARMLQVLKQKVKDFTAEITNILNNESLTEFSEQRLIEIKEEIHTHIPFENPDEHIFHYINGPLIWDNVTLPLFERIIELKKEEYLAQLPSEKRNEYQNLIAEKDIFSLLDNSYHFHFQTKTINCPLVAKIQQDINKIFS